MNKGLIIASFASNNGKTLITLSILHILAKTNKHIQPFKIGPDYIDTQFHQKACNKYSVNLDPFLMNKNELTNIFQLYSYQKIPLIEGAMGYYDGIEDNISNYNVAKTINVPVILIISAKGLYSSIAALIKGMLSYKKNNKINAIIINHISNENHFKRIQYIINKEFPKLQIIGWIQKNCFDKIPSTHLGLDLNSINQNFNTIANKVCKNINLNAIMKLISKGKEKYSPPFSYINTKTQNSLKQKKITIVRDKAFSFIYHDNIAYLKEIFKEVYFVSAMENQTIPKDTNIIYLPGGYVETQNVYHTLNKANKFKNSLVKLAQNKYIYAECAGLIYLGKEITDTQNNILTMSNILNISFKMRKSRKRLGYYLALDLKNKNIYKGHAFHYSQPTKTNNTIPLMTLYKNNKAQIETKKEIGAWTNKKNNIFASYLHIMMRTNHKLIENYFV